MVLMKAFVPFARTASEKKRCFFPGRALSRGTPPERCRSFEAVKITIFEYRGNFKSF